MAYQKLQPTQAADVILSDTINPIDPSRPNKVSGTADGDFTDFLNDISVATESYTGTPGVVEADKLNVTGASPDVSFTNVKVGDTIVNVTTSAYTQVTAVYSNTSLMNSNTDAFVVYVGGGASSNIDIKVTTAAGNDIVFSGFPKGGFLPVQCLRVWTTGTAATNVVALW